MKLVEQYVSEVGTHLSAASRTDIVNELRNSLEEEILDLSGSEKEASISVQKTAIERLGHPIKVAAQYSDTQYLIGPELYPAFVQTLKTVFVLTVGLVVTFHLLVWITQGGNAWPSSLLSNVFEFGVKASVIVLLSFISLEHFGEKLDWYENWKADSLMSSTTIDRGDLMTNLITEGVFLLWWNDAFTFWVKDRPDEALVQLSAAWELLFWPINILVACWFLLHLWVLVRERWNRLTLQSELLLSFIALVASGWLLIQQDLLTFGVDVENTVIAQNSIKITILFVMGVIVWDAWLAIKRLRLTDTS